MKRVWRGGINSAGRARSRAGWLCALACLAAMTVAAGAGLLRGHAQAAFPLPAFDPPKSAAAQTAAPTQQNKQPAGTKAEDASKRQIASECADLLKLAKDLKIEVDKTTKDTLSLTVVRKADEIEQLAHKVRAGSGKS